MATFIAYQPPANTPSFNSHTFGRSSAVGLCGQVVLSRQSLKSPQQAQPQPMNSPDFGDSVDLTTPKQDAPREDLVARDILEPLTAHDPDTHGVRAAGTHTSNMANNDEINDCEECGQQDYGTDYESDTSSLLSLPELVAQWEDEFKRRKANHKCKASIPALIDETSKMQCSEGDTGESGSAAVTAAAGIQLGASQDTATWPDNDYLVNAHGSARSHITETPMIEVADLAPPSGASMALTRVNTEPGTDNGGNTQDSLAKDNMDNYAGDREGGTVPHKNSTLHISTLAKGKDRNDCGSTGSGIGSDVPVSAGQIHDIFTEYENQFGLLRSKRKAARSALSVCRDSGTTVDSTSRYASQRESQVAADDGVTDICKAAEAVETGAAENDAARQSQIGGKSPSQFWQKSGGYDTEVEEPRPFGVYTTLASDCTSNNIGVVPQHLPSPPKIAEDVSGSDPGAAAQGAQARKRSRSPTNSTAYLDNVVPKRPKRAKKESWKAKEAREAREAQSQAPSHSFRMKQPHSSRSGHKLSEVDRRVADIEDAYLGGDGSIQCLVTWKPSLMPVENLVDSELRRRCDQLFRKRYGQQEL